VTTAKATDREVQAALDELGRWTVVEGKFHRQYSFRDFVQAFGFMTQAALLAERAGHHPEWSNVYDKFTVDLTTHQVQDLTQRDLDLALQMERVASGTVPGLSSG
jgi:4a-hydroxytetrahydrobiopterin dehydratase